jgi:hypothetical protein
MSVDHCRDTNPGYRGRAMLRRSRKVAISSKNAGMHASQPGLLGVMILLEPRLDFSR